MGPAGVSGMADAAPRKKWHLVCIRGIAILHAIPIAAHATCGIVALASGIFELRPHTEGVPITFKVYLGAL
jgi:hypothetical protein